MKLLRFFTRPQVAATAILLFFTGEGLALAAHDSDIDKADTAWIIISTALVLLMTPGLALFYAGMTRKKNVLSTMMHSFFILCLISVVWVLWGYSLSFGDDVAGLIGGLNFFALTNVGLDAKGTIPHLLFMLFQGMFAVITVALITGGFAERVKFSAVVIFSVLWLTIVYAPLCHWIWGGGWLGEIGTLDFAGGMVVHISCGVSALVAAIMIGSRRGYPREAMPPHNLGMTLIGMSLLWFGWFGFNGGSALAADGIAVLAIVTTNTSAAVGALTWTFIEWWHRGKPTLLGAISGAVAGLGSITPAAGFVTPQVAIVIGLAGGSLCYYGVSILKVRAGYDDTLDVFGIHGLSGIWGSLSIGLFATVGATGLFTGGGIGQLKSQVIGVIATIAISIVGTYLCLKITALFTDLRVTDEEELMGLDLTQHNESGYNW